VPPAVTPAEATRARASAGPPTGSGNPEAPPGRPSHLSRRRPPLWGEALVIASLCWLYDETINISPLRLPTALAHARSVLAFERAWHLDVEFALNGWAAAHRALALPLADFYDTAHFVVTLGLVAVLWWRHPERYRPLRNALVLTNVIGFIVFWAYPLAPPRMLGGVGFVDLVATTHAWGSWHSGALASQANELAAMPSLHIAWACWSAAAVATVARKRATRWLSILYPVATAIAVIATANHFLMDVLAGAATAGVAGAVAFARKMRR
jgi:PAP2 superfamily protein